MATWWHHNAKFFLLKTPNCSFAFQFICSSHCCFERRHGLTPPPAFIKPSVREKKSLTFINTSNPVPLSQRRDSIDRKHMAPPTSVVCEEPFALRSPLKLHTTNNPPLLWDYSLSWNVSLPQPCRVKKWRSFWCFYSVFKSIPGLCCF